jgi:lysophospholipase L1-like esterase
MDGPKSLIARFGSTAIILAIGLAPRGSVPAVCEAMRDDSRNRADIERMERGYYETLLNTERVLDALAAPEPHVSSVHHESTPFDAGPLTDMVPDVREFVLKPNFRAELRGARWSTNAFGMRDAPYSRVKPAGTIRIAFIGDSIGAGWGVDDGHGFEPSLERALDARSRAAGGPRVEILNFAVPGHAPGQRWEDFTRAGGWSMEPDVVFYEATPADSGWDERRLRGLLARGIGADAPVYRQTLAHCGVRAFGDVEENKRKLRPYRHEILGGVYRTIAEDCRRRGVVSIWVLVPRVGKPADRAEARELIALAKAARFQVVLDLSSAYDGIDPKCLAIGPADFHPNAEGHARLAQRLEQSLARHPAVMRLVPGPLATAGVRP